MSDSQEHEELFAANEDAALFYRRQLLGPDGEGPRQYLTARGFGALLGETAWTVGYAPASWTALYDHLVELGYSDDTLVKAGLVSRTRRDTLVDRFRDRITFGIRQPDNLLCGFTARRGPGASDRTPKYLNTPGTPVFVKRHQLFGLGESRLIAPRASTAILSEGPLDAIAFAIGASTPHKSLATCGTTLAGNHALKIALGNVKRVLLSYDGDAPGQRAITNAYAALAPYFDQVTVSAPSNDRDPAQVFREEGSPGIDRLISAQSDASTVIIDLFIESWPSRGQGIEADLCCLRSATDLLVRVQCQDSAGAARQLVNRLPFDAATVTRELAEAVRRSPTLRA